MKTRTLLAALATTAIVAGSVQAATFTTAAQGTLMSEQASNDGAPGAGERAPYRVSVNETNAGLASGDRFNNPNGTAGTPYEYDFSAPVVAYAFVGGGTNNVLSISRQGGESTRLSFTTTDTTFDYFGQNNLNLWTTTDPGTNLASPTSSPDQVGVGIRGISDITGTIDISGLVSGSVNVVYGGFSALPTLTATMRDTDGGAPDIVIANAHLNGDTANRTEYYFADLAFVNDAGYDEIVYTATGGTGGRQGGVVLTGVVPEPSSLALLGLGGLLIARRRRG